MSVRAGLAGLVVLDRDGLLNEMVAPRAAGEPPDSPLHPGEVRLVAGVPALLRRLCDAGFRLAIASNQPAAAKGKATRAALEAVHARVLAEAESAGARIASSHVCWHRAEDGCACRKPRPGLLEAALAALAADTTPAALAPPAAPPEVRWMVGDRATDVLCGAALGFSTALIGAAAWPGDEELLRARGVRPGFRGATLRAFVDRLVALAAAR